MPHFVVRPGTNRNVITVLLRTVMPVASDQGDWEVGLHAPALLYNIIPGISLYNNNGFPIIMGHKIHVILGVF
jgi:hypothetical protein